MKPKVSVIIPTFNRAEFLPATLGSVFSQSVSPHEVLLIDDGSTDSTPSVVCALLQQNPHWRERLHYEWQPNQGKSVALNLALSRCSGDWIAYLDSDDQWRADKLERQFRALEQAPDCLACFTDSSRLELQHALGLFPQAFEQVSDDCGTI